jgi:hypothetical protein
VVRVLKKDFISGCRDERGGGGPSPGYPNVDSNANLVAFHPCIPPGRCPNQICQTFSAKAAVANSCSSSSHKAQTARTSQTFSCKTFLFSRRVKRVLKRMPTRRGVKKRTTAQVTAYDALSRGSRKIGGNQKRSLQLRLDIVDGIEWSPRNQIRQEWCGGLAWFLTAYCVQ